jgi:ABC-type molybdate transport system ATPase subunit
MLTLEVELIQGAFTLDVSARVDARATALVGPSGAGKTTLLEAIAGLRRPARGEIHVGDRVLFSSHDRVDLPPHQRHVGYVPQDVALFPHMNVRHNLLFGASRNRGTSTALPLERIAAMLEICQGASASAWRLHGHCCRRRTCCSSTSRSPPSTSRSADASCRTCGASATSWASRSCTSRMTWKKSRCLRSG